MNKGLPLGLACVAAVVLALPAARADLAAFRAAQSNESALIHRWDFEGPTFAQALLDRKGSMNMSTGFLNGGTVQLGPGFDATSQAVNFWTPNSTSTGAYLQTASNYTMPTNLTVEFLVRPSTNFNAQYVLAHQPLSGVATQYFILAQNASGMTFERYGRSMSNATATVVGGSSGVTFTMGHTYYVALQYAYADGPSAGDATFTINTYAMDVSITGSLVQTASALVSGAQDNGLGSGARFMLNRAPQTGSGRFNGDIDELAFYSSVLPSSTLQSHASAIYVIPEPGAVALLALGLPLAGWAARRRR